MLGALARSQAAREAADRLRPFYRKLNPWTGLNGLDKAVVAHLPAGGGYFVEAGANDGLKQSNTYYLEARRGWRGLLVEPSPTRADRARRNRPGSTVVSAALVPPELDGTVVELLDVDLMSLVRGARGSAEQDEAHVSAGEVVQGVSRQVLQVPGRTLSAILDDIRAPAVDFLSLDLEGYEHEALQGLDLDRHVPSWILVEHEDQAAIGDLLGDGYEMVGALSHHDWLFRRRDRQ